ncbi:MAG: amino acid adenylation domain-containing protein [Acidobacteriota bacterium]|nr:amino acid adenylation domain-containing protein [Acidobacteriota bacterium]
MHPSEATKEQAQSVSSSTEGAIEETTGHGHTALHDLATAEARTPFDLQNGPLFRARLIHLDNDDHLLLLTMHHLITDGWSMGVLLNEVSTFYSAALEGKKADLPELDIQYADFALWQQELLAGDKLDAARAWWKQYLADAPKQLNLPVDRPRGANSAHNGRAIHFHLDDRLTASLHKLSGRAEASLFMILQAAFAVLLARHSGQDDVVTGATSAGRNRAETEGLIGLFLNTLALRTDIGVNPTFEDLLATTRLNILEAFTHQDLPVEAALEEAGLLGGAFQAFFIFQNTPLDALQLPGLTMERLAGKPETAKFELTLEMEETEAGLTGFFEYDTDLFEEATIQRLVGRFKRLLAALAGNPATRVYDLPILESAEETRLLTGWNQTETGFADTRPVHLQIADRAAANPGAIAVKAVGGSALTYGELMERAGEIAARLCGLGVTAEVPVGLFCDRAPEMIVAQLGILLAGGVFLPLDPNYPRERLVFMLQDAACPVVISQPHLTGQLPADIAHVLTVDEFGRPPGGAAAVPPPATVHTEQTAYLIYTSGSTGKPKGVAVPHGALTNFVCATAEQYQLTPQDRVLQFATINFDTAMEEIFPALLSGARLVLRNDEMLLSSDNFLDRCIAEEITFLDLPTAYWQQLTADMIAADLALPKNLRVVIIGGERAAPDTVRAWRNRVGAAPLLMNTYGPTEACVVAVATDLSRPEPGDEVIGEVPIGTPLANVRAHVLDRYLSPVPVGVTGQLYLAGAGLARGYHGNPSASAEKFVPDPFHSESGRMYATGDLARRLPDGRLQFQGRVDRQVKIRGFRIELTEVETILERHPDVRQAAAVFQESHQRLAAFVQPKAGMDPAALIADLRRTMRETVPDYMVPGAFATPATLPLNANGKIDRKALPMDALGGAEATYVGPRTPVEEQLCAVWAEILQVERVGVQDNFFDLGGHSLLVTRIVSRIRAVWPVELSLRYFLEDATVAGLAGYIEASLFTTNYEDAPAEDDEDREEGEI